MKLPVRSYHPFGNKMLGISLIEILIVVALIGLSVIPLVSSARQASQTQSLKTSVSILEDTLLEARNSSRDARDQMAWGVISTEPNTYQFISGSESSYKVTKSINLESGVTFKEDFSVWFQIGSGNLLSQKTVVLSNTIGNSYEVTVNTSGLIDTKAI